MRYLALTPETHRVRSAARAHAAGEMSRGEYRRIRREAIDSFTPAEPVDGDDTERRWHAAEALGHPPPRRPFWTWGRVLLFKTVVIAALAWWML